MSITLQEIKKASLSHDVEKEIYSFYLGQLRKDYLSRVKETVEKRLKDGQEPNIWYQASIHGLPNVMRSLLTTDRTDRRSTTEHHWALMTACAYGHLEVVTLLLKSGADPSWFECKSLRSAARNGHTKVVKILLADPRVDPSLRNNTPLRYAYDYGHQEVVDRLLSHPKVNPQVIEGRPTPGASFCPVGEFDY